MQNKILLFFVLLFASMTNAQIVTSKKEAIKKGVYTTPTEKKDGYSDAGSQSAANYKTSRFSIKNQNHFKSETQTDCSSQRRE